MKRISIIYLTKMSNFFFLIKFLYIKLLKTVVLANDKWQQANGFDLLHHIWQVKKG